MASGTPPRPPEGPGEHRAPRCPGQHRPALKADLVVCDPPTGVTEQRRYGTAFRSLSAFGEGMRKVDELSRRLAEVARDGLAAGALVPEE